jgi:osmotically-inducible protein OsmY
MKYNDALKPQERINRPERAMDCESDAEIKYNIYKALQRAAEAEAHSVTAERKAGRVILRGTARTFAERREMEAAAWSTPGVLEVENQIKLAA